MRLFPFKQGHHPDGFLCFSLNNRNARPIQGLTHNISIVVVRLNRRKYELLSQNIILSLFLADFMLSFMGVTQLSHKFTEASFFANFMSIFFLAWVLL